MPEEAGAPKSIFRDYFESICVAVIFALFVRTFVVQAFKIPSSSMEDSLLVGDHILVDKFAFAPHPAWQEKLLPYRPVKHRDVVVFKYPRDPQRDFIKRVVGTSGDSVAIQRGRVIRNGEALDDASYVFNKPSPGRPGCEVPIEMLPDHRTCYQRPMRIGESQYFVMGDNRLNSEDSRFWGTVPGSHVKGRALLIYWSFDVPEHLKPTEVNGNATLGEKGLSLGYTMLHFFDKSRWMRTFKIIR